MMKTLKRGLMEEQQRLTRLVDEMEKELQVAHDMQMGLMPTAPPQIEGFDVAGRCIPAEQVGGDYFQYFERDGKLFISLADVTGHSMEAAIPAVMFSGILRSYLELAGTLQERFEGMNRALRGALTGHTLVCLVMAELDPSTRILRLSNGGCPYPYHYRASTGELVELEGSAGPLGVRPEISCKLVEMQLASGDRVILCSDGISEAMDADEKLFGDDRTAEVIRRGCEENLSAEEMIDRILEVIDQFRGDTPPSDDMTLVVVRAT